MMMSVLYHLHQQHTHRRNDYDHIDNNDHSYRQNKCKKQTDPGRDVIEVASLEDGTRRRLIAEDQVVDYKYY